MLPNDVVTAYASAVLAGEVVTSTLVRLACQRHLDDLRNGADRGLQFHPDRAQHVLDFFEQFLRLENDEPFHLQPFQQFIVGSLFGWYQGAFRRFRTAFIELGKGSGKTPVAAGVGLYGLIADGQPAAEIYSAATTREQAGICFRDAKRMIEASPDLRDIVEVGAGNLAILKTSSFFRPVSAEHKGLDGKRVHIAIVDELHEHPSSLVVDKMRAGTKRQRDALIFEITNSGVDRHSVCWNHHEYSTKVLRHVIEDDAWFAYVAGLDPCAPCASAGKEQPDPLCEQCDDWKDESTWIKANPGLDTILPRTYLQEQVREASNMPAKENIVRRLNFCQWTEQATKWLSMDLWDACAGETIDPATLRGRDCYGGLDLAKVNDLSAFVLLFPPKNQGERWDVLAWFWLPEDDLHVRVARDRVPYDVWQRQGLIVLTPGNVTDYGFIRVEILKLANFYNIKEIGYDRTFAGEIVQELQAEGLTMVQFGQGFLSMAAPCAELERMVKGKELHHGGHPVLRWNASNVTIALDAAGNMKPDKEHSSERVDGIVASLNALGRALTHPVPKKFVSVYETRGLLDLRPR